MEQKAVLSGIPQNHVYFIYITDLKADMNIIFLFTLVLSVLLSLPFASRIKHKFQLV